MTTPLPSPQQHSLTGTALHDAIAQVQALTAAGDHHAAATLACQIADQHGANAGAQSRAAMCLLQSGDHAAARTYIDRARQIAPDVTGFRIQAAKIYLRCQDPSAALLVLTPAFEDGAPNAELCHVGALAAEDLGDAGLAVQLAQQACQIDPDNPSRGLALASLYLRLDRLADAAATFEHCLQHPQIRAIALRGLSGVQLRMGDASAALASIDQAIAELPDRADFHLHRIGVLRRLGQNDAARTALEQLIITYPDDLRLQRNLVAIHVAQGDHAAALRRGAALLAAAPDVPEYIACMQSLLTHRAGDAPAPIHDIAALKRGSPRRAYRAKLGYQGAARRTGQIIFALVLREIRTRYGRNRLSFLWALIEPLAHIAVLATFFYLANRSNPPLGTSFVLFYFTGVQPFLLFSQIAQKAGNSVLSSRGLLQLPQVTPMDIICAKAIVETLIVIFIILAFGLGLSAFGVSGFPVQPLYLIAAFALAALLGLGAAHLLAVIKEAGRAFDVLFSVVFRVLYLSSGVFFLPANLPQWVRDILLWNPCLHIVDMWRRGYYEHYTAPYLDPLYVVVWVIICLGLGLVVLRLASPWLRGLR